MTNITGESQSSENNSPILHELIEELCEFTVREDGTIDNEDMGSLDTIISLSQNLQLKLGKAVAGVSATLTYAGQKEDSPQLFSITESIGRYIRDLEKLVITCIQSQKSRRWPSSQGEFETCELISTLISLPYGGHREYYLDDSKRGFNTKMVSLLCDSIHSILDLEATHLRLFASAMRAAFQTENLEKDTLISSLDYVTEWTSMIENLSFVTGNAAYAIEHMQAKAA